MAILLGINHLTKSFGARPLFDDLNLVLESGDRIGLIGPNGAGKSTLLRILSGEISPDGGTLSPMRGLRVGYLKQTPDVNLDSTVFDVVLEGTKDADEDTQLATAHEFLSYLSLDGDVIVKSLSGGWKKRVALARELARRPDLLLLDEPTNHLDVESILWLEKFLARSSFATLTITHDRLFLQRISNRILELDRRNPGGLLDVRGDYATYLERKELLLSQQQSLEERLRNNLRRETEWLRRGPKARTTKQQARINRAGELEKDVKELQYRNQDRSASLDFETTGRAPKKLVEAEGITKKYQGKTVFSNLDVFIGPKSRIGLLGTNGCGKSTLIRVLLGKEEPDGGKIFRSEHLKVAYFEQERESLDPDLTLIQTLNPNADQINYRGKLVHVKGYLQKFLFRTDQLEMKVGRLSGGEQSRLLIARLMLHTANVLVLDEPTNDLDIATLDMLEECLEEFEGAVLLVTHDRYFLDRVAKEIVAFDPRPSHRGKTTTFAGLDQWETWHDGLDAPAEKMTEKPKEETPAPAKKKQLGYKEKRELESIEPTIQKVEARLAELTAESEDSKVQSDAAKLTEIYKAIGDKQAELDKLYERWAELDALK